MASRKPPLMVRVLVFELINNEIVRDYTVNLAISSRWIYRLMVWASNSHYSVEIVNVNDDRETGE